MIWNVLDFSMFLRVRQPGDQVWICEEPGSNDPIKGGIVASLESDKILVVYTAQQMYKPGKHMIHVEQISAEITDEITEVALAAGLTVFTSPDYPLSDQARAEIDFVLNTRGI